MIGEELEAQVRLLMLQQGEITPFGTAESEAVDVRIIAATIETSQDIAAGKFRETFIGSLRAF